MTVIQIPKYEQQLDELQKKAQALNELLAKYSPYRLIHRSFWEFMLSFSGLLGDDDDVARDDPTSLRVLEFVLNYYASSSSEPHSKLEPTEEEWAKICETIDDVNKRCNFLLMSDVPLKLKLGANDEAAKDLYTSEALNWLNVRGDRFDVHEAVRLTHLLRPHSEIFQQLFQISSDEFLGGIQRLHESLVFGLGEAMEDFDGLCAELDMSPDAPRPDRISTVHSLSTEDSMLAERAASAFDRMIELGVCDAAATTKFPAPLLEALAWDSGQDQDYNKEGDFAGLPLRMTPTMKKPFIKLNGRYYCFTKYQLFDNIYRTIEKIVRERAPDYYLKHWSKKQATASENDVAELIRAVMPDAEIMQSVYYGPPETSTEADIVVTFDRTLLIFEVKAVAKLSVGPIENFEVYLQKLSEIIGRPLFQGLRLLDKLSNEKAVTLYEGPGANKRPVKELKYDDYDKIIIVGVSVDNLSHIACSRAALSQMKIHRREQVMSIALDDLRIVSDIFSDKPFQFLHYLQKRYKAMAFKQLHLYDEIDHVGLYITYNDYVDALKDKIKPSSVHMLTYGGADDTIKKYYSERFKARGASEIPLPSQKLPPIIPDILKVLRNSKRPGATRLANILLDMGSQGRQNFQSSVEQSFLRLRDAQKIAPAIILGDYNIFIFAYPNADTLSRETLQTYLWSRLVAHRREAALGLVLYFSFERELTGIEFEFASSKDIPHEMQGLIQYEAEDYSARYKKEISQFKKKKLGPNAPCYCGSGKKYKKCHRQ